MALTLGPTSLFFKGRFFPPEELTAMASAWAECIQERLPRSCDSVAIALANHPQAIALFFALSSLPLPLFLLSPDPRTWRSSPPIPAGTPLFLAPALEQLTRSGEALGLRTYALPEPRISPPCGGLHF